MGAVIAMFMFVTIGCLVLGAYLIRRGLRPSAAPPIPAARIANPDGGEAIYARAARAPRKLGKGVLVTVGVAIIMAPWALAYAVVSSFSNMGMGSKGRVLRIKNRARLADPAVGAGWSGEPVVLATAPAPEERAALGALWLVAARMEHASVAAFSQLGLHLAALGAPARLLEATHRAALDEIRHARRCFAIVRALTGVEESAGPIGALAEGNRTPIDLTRLAIGSLVDGCLAEGIAADVAAASAQAAGEPAIAATLAMIARDEAGHAELAWDVLAWCLDGGDPSLRRAVAARVEALGDELAPRLPPIAGVDAAVLARHGVIDQDALGAIGRARIAAVQARARGLLGGDVRLAA